MKSTIWTSILAMLLAAVIGCGGDNPPAGDGDDAGGGDDSAATTPTTPPTPKAAQLPPEDATPDVVVATFLDSLRSGDDATAEALLTERARIETERANLAVEPPGTPSARYAVGQVQYVTENKDGAHVGSVWEDSYDDGTTATYNVTWVLRRQSQGWRIVGLATQPRPDKPEIFLNFENPQEMLDKVAKANAELTGEGQETPAATTAQNPDVPPSKSFQR
ncbi:MAG: hypothetical protein RIC55_10705 [Pirellulaceae bacterium]